MQLRFRGFILLYDGEKVIAVVDKILFSPHTLQSLSINEFPKN